MSHKWQEYKNFDAYQLLHKTKQKTLPIDLEVICKELEIDYSEARKSSNDSGTITYDQKTGKVAIWVNPDQAPVRKRFTLAHELGHFFNDIVPAVLEGHKVEGFTDNDMIFKRNGLSSDIENKANSFAAALLMPVKAVEAEIVKFHREYTSSNNSTKIPAGILIKKLSEKFNVSDMAMRIRLRILGIYK